MRTILRLLQILGVACWIFYALGSGRMPPTGGPWPDEATCEVWRKNYIALFQTKYIHVDVSPCIYRGA